MTPLSVCHMMEATCGKPKMLRIRPVTTGRACALQGLRGKTSVGRFGGPLGDRGQETGAGVAEVNMCMNSGVT